MNGKPSFARADEDIPDTGYNWKYIVDVAREHKRA